MLRLEQVGARPARRAGHRRVADARAERAARRARCLSRWSSGCGAPAASTPRTRRPCCTRPPATTPHLEALVRRRESRRAARGGRRLGAVLRPAHPARPAGVRAASAHRAAGPHRDRPARDRCARRRAAHRRRPVLRHRARWLPCSPRPSTTSTCTPSTSTRARWPARGATSRHRRQVHEGDLEAALPHRAARPHRRGHGQRALRADLGARAPAPGGARARADRHARRGLRRRAPAPPGRRGRGPLAAPGRVARPGDQPGLGAAHARRRAGDGPRSAAGDRRATSTPSWSSPPTPGSAGRVATRWDGGCRSGGRRRTRTGSPRCRSARRAPRARPRAVRPGPGRSARRRGAGGRSDRPRGTDEPC